MNVWYIKTPLGVDQAFHDLEQEEFLDGLLEISIASEMEEVKATSTFYFSDGERKGFYHRQTSTQLTMQCKNIWCTDLPKFYNKSLESLQNGKVTQNVY